MNIMGRLLGTSFMVFIGGAAQSRIFGITGSIALIVLLGLIVIMLANKFFSLIHHLPENVTNWIGQQFHSLGEKEDQAGMQGRLSGAASAATSSTGQALASMKAKKDNDKGDKGGGKPKATDKNLT